MTSTRHARATRAPRPHRWAAWLVAAMVVLGAYAVALRWVTLRVESGVAASIHAPTTDGQPQQPGE